MTQKDFMIILLGYERIYGLDGGGLKRVSEEISTYNIESLLQIASKISLKLFSGSFTDQSNQIQMIKDIFAKNHDIRKRIVASLNEIFKSEGNSAWAVFAEQSILNLFKIIILRAKKIGGKLIEEEDVEKVGKWLLILNDVCMGSEKFLSIQLPPKEELEYLREYITRQFFFMSRERIAYKAVRFKSLFEKIRKLHPEFEIDKKFFDATNGAKVDDYISICFFLMVNFINKTTKNDIDLTKEWFLSKKKYFEKTILNELEIEKVLSLLLLDIDEFSNIYEEDVKIILKGNDSFPFNFLQFRKNPLVPIENDCFVCPSAGLLIDKATSGLYWIIENYLRNQEQKNEWKLFPSIWGEAFEDYINDRLSNSFGKNYISNPLKKNGDEISDGLIYGKKSFFIVETKYAHWSNLAMLTGKEEYIVSTLKQILSSPKKKKGLGQIKRSIEEIEKGEVILPKKIVDRKIIPIIIVGESMPMDWPNRDFYEKFAKKSKSFCESSTVLPFIILDVEEIEMIEAIAIDNGIDEAEKLLTEYSMLFLRKNRLGFVPESVPFKNFLNSTDYKVPNNANLFKLFEQIHQIALKKGFKENKIPFPPSPTSPPNEL